MNESDRKMIAYWLNECEQSADAKQARRAGDGGETWRRRAGVLRDLLHKPDPQDCPTCRALIEATMRELDATPGGTDD